jgi:hypothetical protein
MIYPQIPSLQLHSRLAGGFAGVFSQGGFHLFSSSQVCFLID